MHPQMDTLRHLPAVEKLQIVEELWDDLAGSPDPLPLPEWHRDEATRRLTELDADPSIAIDRDELWRQVDERHG